MTQGSKTQGSETPDSKTPGSKTLRSNFTPGSTPWAMRRAQWTALGLTEADLEKPKIAIVNSSSQLASCFSHLDQIVGPLKEAIAAAGGVAFEVRTAAPSDAITSAGAAGQYILPSRDLIASDIEVAVEGALLDGMVCLASCDKTTPGQLMAAGRLNIPTIVVGLRLPAVGGVPGGGGRLRGHLPVRRARQRRADDGRRARPDVALRGDRARRLRRAWAPPTPCTWRPRRWAWRCRARRRCWRSGPPCGARSRRRASGSWAWSRRTSGPASILTPAAFANAVTAILAVSGSVNCLKHLQAIAVEAGADVDVYRLFETLAPKVPLLTDVKPNGNTQITEFEAAGGTLGLLRQLAPLLDLSARTVAGGTLGDAIDGGDRRIGHDRGGRRRRTGHDRGGGDAGLGECGRGRRQSMAGGSREHAGAGRRSASTRTLSGRWTSRWPAHPAIVVMRGSLAPDGAVLKRTVADDAPLTFRGPAKVVRSRDEGVAAAKAGRFAAGDVVVLTGLGLRGSPGMGLTSALMFAIDGAGLSTSVAVITDGQMSGLVNGGLVIAEVSPEGAAGGPLGLVRDGDLISIDVNARTVDLEVEAAELAARRAALPPLAAPAGCGWLSVYARSVAPLGSGATLGGRRDLCDSWA